MSVGRPVPRKDALEKVQGRALYLDDETPEGCWYGATVWSSIPHGTIVDIHLPELVRDDNMVVVGPRDIPGPNLVALIEEDQPLLADGYVRHVGEPLLLLAGPDRERVWAAARAVRVDYEPLPAVTDLRRAIDTPAEGCRTSSPIRIRRGDLDAAFADADVIVEGTYWTGHQEQLYIEPQGFTAWWEEDGSVVVKGSLQCPYYVHKALRRIFNLGEEEVRVIGATTGGGFGGKEDFPSVIAGHTALLARKAGRPVKMTYDRKDDFLCTTKRHPARLHYRTGLKRDGTFVVCQAEIHIDCGAYVTLSPVVLSRAAIHAAGPYDWPVVDVHGRPVATHTPPNGAFRGFGAPQVYFGLERHVDKMAEAVGMNPVVLRRQNLLRPGRRTATGQLLDESVGAPAVLDEAVKRFGGDEAFERGSSRRSLPSHRAEGGKGGEKGEAVSGVDGGRPAHHGGIGLALYMHGTGFTGSGEARMETRVGMRLAPNAFVEILTGSTDIGQGTATVFPQIAATALGVSFERIRLSPVDTLRVPDSGPTVASRTVSIVGRVVQNLAESMKARLLEVAARLHGGGPGDYDIVDDWLVARHDKSRIRPFSTLALAATEEGPIDLEDVYRLDPSLRWDERTYRGDAYPAYSWGCTVAEVRVDADTLEVGVERLVAVHDIGTVVHPLLAAGQVEGGIAQGLGYGLMEEVIVRDGTMVNPSFTNYIIPTARDLPELDVDFVEKPWKGGPFGAKGVGELPMNGPAPALANAVSAALGVHVDVLPLTPERLLEALDARKAGEQS